MTMHYIADDNPSHVLDWNGRLVGACGYQSKEIKPMTTQEASTPNADQIAALARYAKANGRTWKTKLADAWLDGRDAREPDGCYLRQVRNSFGPSWLRAYRLPE